MNDKLDKLNQSLDPNSATQPKPSEPPNEDATGKQARQQAKQTAAPGKKRYDRKGACNDFGWKKPQPPDPALEPPSSYLRQYVGNVPDPPQPAGTFSLEDLGQTKSIRVVFPPQKSKTLNTVNGRQRVIEDRDPTGPFEAELSFHDGKLLDAFCDENGVYHDSGEGYMRRISKELFIDNEEGVKKGLSWMGGPDAVSSFTCISCYFVNQVFHSGHEHDKFVVMVNPEIAESPRYFVIRVKTWPAMLVAGPIPNLCQLRNPTRLCTCELLVCPLCSQRMPTANIYGHRRNYTKLNANKFGE